MKSYNPLVSIVIPTYGRAELLVQTISSVLNQSYLNNEIIIVDDNGRGTPNQQKTEKQLETILNSNIRYIPLEKNCGGSHARNVGARSSMGKYICFLDDDDLFEPTKVEKQVELMENTPSLVGCYCNHKRVNHITGKTSVYENNKSGNLLLDVLLFNIDVCSGSTLMVRRELFEILNGFTENLSRFQDYEFLTRLCAEGELGLVPEPLVIINTHAGSNCNKTFAKDEKDRLKYLEVVQSQIDSLSPKDKESVIFANNAYLFISAIKLHSIRGCIKYLLKCGFNERTFNLVSSKFKKLLR